MSKYEKMIKILMESNPLVRFSAVSDNDGNIEWFGQRDDVRNLIPIDETKKSIQRAVKSWNLRGEIIEKAGKGKYSIVAYEKIKRITIPLDENHILLISTDNKSEEFGESLNMNSILSFVDFLILMK